MTPLAAFFVAWVAGAALMIGLAAILGARRGRVFGLLVDSRKRLSLSQLQAAAWCIAIVPLFAGTIAGRLAAHSPDPLGFAIPAELL